MTLKPLLFGQDITITKAFFNSKYDMCDMCRKNPVHNFMLIIENDVYTRYVCKDKECILNACLYLKLMVNE